MTVINSYSHQSTWICKANVNRIDGWNRQQYCSSTGLQYSIFSYSNELNKKGADINRTQITEEYTFFSSVHRTFCKTCKILDYYHACSIQKEINVFLSLHNIRNIKSYYITINSLGMCHGFNGNNLLDNSVFLGNLGWGIQFFVCFHPKSCSPDSPSETLLPSPLSISSERTAPLGMPSPWHIKSLPA